MHDYKNLKFCPRCGAKFISIDVFGRKRKVCSLCGYILYRNPFPGTSVIIENNGKILLVKRDEEPHQGWWSLPGGYVEYQESFEKAAIREVAEETGYSVKITELIGVYFYNKKVQANSVGPTFLAKITGGKPSKYVTVRWFAPDKLPKRFAYPDQLKAIIDWRKRYGR